MFFVLKNCPFNGTWTWKKKSMHRNYFQNCSIFFAWGRLRKHGAFWRQDKNKRCQEFESSGFNVTISIPYLLEGIYTLARTHIQYSARTHTCDVKGFSVDWSYTTSWLSLLVKALIFGKGFSCIIAHSVQFIPFLIGKCIVSI